jgi:histidinol phosphatase-like PHP family hydrolase
MQYADKLGLDFVFFSEHSSSPGAPKKLSEDHPISQSLLEGKNKIAEINKQGNYRPKAYSAVEANIMFDDGEARIDVPNSVLAQLDLVVASRHVIDEKFEPQKIKESMLTAINNPEVDIIGHPYRSIEFYEHDWRYFKKYYTKDEVISQDLEALEKNSEWDKVKMIIGKTEPKGEKMEHYHELFKSLKNEYWEAWTDILGAMENKGTAFEINLSSFNPEKEYYQTLLAETAKYPNLNYSITFDFHSLGQLDNYNNKNYKTEKPAEIKNPARAKGVQRMLELIALLEKNGISKNRVINSSQANLDKFLASRG